MTGRDLEEPLITPLVKALTRAPTLMGVPYLVFMVNGVASSVCFLLSHNLFMLLVAIPLHLFGYVMTLRDDRISRSSSSRPPGAHPAPAGSGPPTATAPEVGSRWWRAPSWTS